MPANIKLPLSSTVCKPECRHTFNVVQSLRRVDIPELTPPLTETK